LKTSTTFRALSLGFGIHIASMNLSCRNPTHTTLLNWIHKIGYYELTKKKEKADDWIIIIDESIQLGQDKVLMIYGIREKNIDFTRPLNFQDLVPLREITKAKWNGPLISEIIFDLKEELGNIKYAVGDYGSDLRKGLEMAEIAHVHDLTHRIALFLEKEFKDNISYNEIIKNMTEMRMKYSQSNMAHIIPPNQRKKSRYQNIKRISDWCVKIINLIENKNVEKEIIEKSKWIMEHKSFVDKLQEVNCAINEIERILKYNGLSIKTEKECIKIINNLKSEIGIKLTDELKNYFKGIKKIIPCTKNILISSDIIESAFGKYKNYISTNPMAGVTNLILCLSAFTSSLKENEIKKALEGTTINDIKEWTKEFVGKTLLQKRREVLSCG
jgi:hypothetical protein